MDKFGYKDDRGEGGFWDGYDPYNQSYESRGVIEYEQDPDTQMYLPSGTRSQDIDLPTETEVQTNAMAYLARHRGKFEDAYWQLEDEYSELEICELTDDVLRELILIQRTIDYICADPEYINDLSISSLWEALWQQQHLVGN